MLPDEHVFPVPGASDESVAPPPPDVVGRAFDALYFKYEPILRKYAIGHFRVPAADADDLVQGVFTTFLERSEAVDNPARYLVGGICNAAR
jgi:DNA-directed RNA polymerase specialized sigma24 family protein